MRLFGNGIDYLDRDMEEKIMRLAAKEKLGPELIGCFEGGRVEQWLQAAVLQYVILFLFWLFASPFSVKDLPKYSTAIAAKLAKFHDTQLKPDFPVESGLFDRLVVWLQKAREVAFE